MDCYRAYAPVVLVGLLAACGGDDALPKSRLPATQAVVNTAREAGAAEDARAAMHLRLAQANIDRARALSALGEDERADFAIRRAQADAELALLLAREAALREDAERAQAQLKALGQ
jgi:hypothetical protein